GSPISASSTGRDGLSRPPTREQEFVKSVTPTRGERAAFRLLPLIWIGVAVLAGVILYAVFT
ncbi:MAG TPA: hypothetical protein VK273_00495, partial [Gaiellaceae bacterium]|nr:hypothetical protein [Gaiellaceae bacterium]